MEYEKQVREAFPELREIDDEELRARVVSTWTQGLDMSEYNDITDIPWWPPYEQDVGEQQQVAHVRDVTACASALADTLSSRRDLELDRDTVVAGALLHDVSKALETTPDGVSTLQEWLSHPHFAVYLLEHTGCSLHLQHIALAHSPRTGVEPKTIEAQIVATADDIAAHGIFWENSGRLKDVVR